MAAGTKKSVLITNIETNPIVRVENPGGILRVHVDQVEVATTNIDDIGDVIMLGALPSSAKITSIKFFADDLDSNGTPTLAFNVGGYYLKNNIVSGVAKASGVVVDADNIATAIIVGQAASADVTNVGKVGYECRFEAADIDTIEYPLWQLLGLTEDCGGLLAIGLTVSAAAATAAAGGIKMVVHYYN